MRSLKFRVDPSLAVTLVIAVCLAITVFWQERLHQTPAVQEINITAE